MKTTLNTAVAFGLFAAFSASTFAQDNSVPRRIRTRPVDPFVESDVGTGGDAVRRRNAATANPATGARAVTDPQIAPALRRTMNVDEYWKEYGRWYNGEYVPYYTRRNSDGSTYIRWYGGPAAIEVERDRAYFSEGPTVRSGPYNRERYLFYERDRRFNPNPHPGGGFNYNMVK